MIDGQVSFYQQIDYRADWDNPSPAKVAESLRRAHGFGRIAQTEINRLTDENRLLRTDVDKARAELEKSRDEVGKSRLGITLLSTILSTALSSGIVAFMFKMYGR